MRASRASRPPISPSAAMLAPRTSSSGSESVRTRFATALWSPSDPSAIAASYRISASSLLNSRSSSGSQRGSQLRPIACTAATFIRRTPLSYASLIACRTQAASCGPIASIARARTSSISSAFEITSRRPDSTVLKYRSRSRPSSERTTKRPSASAASARTAASSSFRMSSSSLGIRPTPSCSQRPRTEWSRTPGSSSPAPCKNNASKSYSTLSSPR